MRFPYYLNAVPDTGNKKSSTRSEGVTLLHFIGKFGGVAVALDRSGQEHKLLEASVKGEYQSLLIVITILCRR